MPFNKFNDFKGFNGFPLGFQRRAMSSILTFLCPLSSAFLSASPFLRLPVSSGSCLQPQAKRSSNLQPTVRPRLQRFQRKHLANQKVNISRMSPIFPHGTLTRVQRNHTLQSPQILITLYKCGSVPKGLPAKEQNGLRYY